MLQFFYCSDDVVLGYIRCYMRVTADFGGDRLETGHRQRGFTRCPQRGFAGCPQILQHVRHTRVQSPPRPRMTQRQQQHVPVAQPAHGPRLLRRISIANRPRPFRVAVLGQNGVGKSALTVRFLTRRFIGDYDPNLEKIYTCTRVIDGDTVVFEVLDTATQENERCVEENIRWADAYILLYSVTDRCSLNECLRLKFLINSYGKRNRKLSVALPETALSSNPVALVGNQNDRSLDRMIPMTEGVACGAQLGCVAFYEISVRECCDSVHTIFEDLYTCYKRPKKFRAVYPRRAVSVCSFDTINSDNGGASGTNDDSEAAADNDDGATIKVKTKDGGGEAVTSVNPDTPVAKRRGALQSIS